MIRFAVACLLLIVSLSGLILAIRGIGKVQPDPIAVLFTNPDGSACKIPCLLGVRTGGMTIGESLQVLEAHPLTRNMQQQTFKHDGVPYGVVLSADGLMIEIRTLGPYKDASVQVDSIAFTSIPNETPLLALPEPEPRLAAAQAAMTAGGVFLYFGRPDEVYFPAYGSGGEADLLMTFGEKGLMAYNRLEVYPYSRRARMDVNGALDSLLVYSLVPRTRGNYPWFGFVPVRSYMKRWCDQAARMPPGRIDPCL
jgi:hypothetical protein